MPKITLITGGSRGIGTATARLAAQRGYSVCICFLHNQAALVAICIDIPSASFLNLSQKSSQLLAGADLPTVFCASLPPRDGVRDAPVTLKQYAMVVSRCSVAIYSPVPHQPSRTKPTEPMAEQLLGRRLDAADSGAAI